MIKKKDLLLFIILCLDPATEIPIPSKCLGTVWKPQRISHTNKWRVRLLLNCSPTDGSLGHSFITALLEKNSLQLSEGVSSTFKYPWSASLLQAATGLPRSLWNRSDRNNKGRSGRRPQEALMKVQPDFTCMRQVFVYPVLKNIMWCGVPQMTKLCSLCDSELALLC